MSASSGWESGTGKGHKSVSSSVSGAEFPRSPTTTNGCLLLAAQSCGGGQGVESSLSIPGRKGAWLLGGQLAPGGPVFCPSYPGPWQAACTHWPGLSSLPLPLSGQDQVSAFLCLGHQRVDFETSQGPSVQETHCVQLTFIEHLLCDRSCPKHLSWSNFLNPHNTPLIIPVLQTRKLRHIKVK